MPRVTDLGEAKDPSLADPKPMLVPPHQAIIVKR